ncbi:putative ribonuclease [Gordonia hirsuta DSM 44140 = NBRC 16056]|uniref:Putative ribonuclease n=1 Tax=Gordonia hirsuta DSM 44140 = NBRC 16056 TaxID=1121927 RepID=L7L9G7_9ACTN|nr:YhjD/YihY/BrkB family envelope integrity protein [Gordonia hirsuta]GAC56678.1 putative ribonuclease [Gordonia hirsuta DSM 44140 = NBRC 16056]
MGSVVAKAKELVERLKALWEQAQEKWPWLTRLLATLERYNQQRGNLYASSIAFSGIVAMVPILMVAFAIAGFVLASRPELVTQITDAVVDAVPGELGETLSGVIDSAIESRATVGTIGLISAALTGIGWMGLARNGLTEMWGGRIKRNPVKSKVLDLAHFIGLGLTFALVIGLSVVATGPVADWVVEHVHVLPESLESTVLRWGTVIAAVLAMWALFTVVLGRLPIQHVPIRVVAPTALVIALIFEALFTLGSAYLQSMFTSPAGAAFGPVLGVMAFAYLASRIVLYGAAWSAAGPQNQEYRVTDQILAADDERDGERPVVLAPVYETSPAPKAAGLLTAAGIGGLIAGLWAWLRRG